MIVAIQQTTWDLIGQIGVWFVGFPLMIGGLTAYIAVQVIAEKRENDRVAGRWGLAAKAKNDAE